MCQNILVVAVDILSFQRWVQLAFFILSFWRCVHDWFGALCHYGDAYRIVFVVVVVVDILLFSR